MSSTHVPELTSFLNSITELVRAKHGDQGAIGNSQKAVRNLQTADEDYLDPAFVDACNELASAAAMRVAIASDVKAGDEEKAPKFESGEITPHRVRPADPSKGTQPSDLVGEGIPEEHPTHKKPQPSIHATGEGSGTGDLTAKGSGRAL
jgi:hypothetical protein